MSETNQESDGVDDSAEEKVVPAPEPFTNMELSDELQQAVAKMGYVNATDVQRAAIGPALGGGDLLVQAKTGSGKTSTFGIPLIQRLSSGKAAPNRPKAMVLAPTRELAQQVSDELARLAEFTDVSVFPIYGGVSIDRQARALSDGLDVAVGTPGRILDHIRRDNLNLGAIEYFVLDEADEMLSMGFWDDVTNMLNMSPSTRQTMLFSATLPYQIVRASKQFLKDHKLIDVSGDELTVDGIDNCVVDVIPGIPKPRQLLYLLEVEQPSSAIIFCNTRNETEMIAKYLTQSGFVAEALMGAFRQNERERVMNGIKSGSLRFMVATDIAARGIDIEDLSHVFNYSLPEFSEVYLHRVGRTGRAGKTGVAVSLVDGKGLGTYSDLEKQFGVQFIKRELPDESVAQRLRSERIMKELMDRAAVSEVGAHIPVADEILKSDSAGQMVAFLLKSYYAAQTQESSSSRDDSPRRSDEDRGEREGGGPRRRNRKRGPRGRGRDQEGQAAQSGGRDSSDGDRDSGEGGEGRQKRSRRGRRGGRRSGGGGGESGTREPGNRAPVAANHPVAVAKAPPAEGNTHVSVNIGFDDGFRGRGAVAKKIAVLAGLNDGAIKEVDAKRSTVMLEVANPVAELLMERVDGAQIGKKVIEVSVSQEPAAPSGEAAASSEATTPETAGESAASAE